MYMPVGSSALETAFQLAITVNFCLAVSGSRGSVAAGGGGEEPSFPPWLRDFVVASLLSSQPMLWLQVPNATPCVAKDTNWSGQPVTWGTITTLCRETRRLRGGTSIPLPLSATFVQVYNASADPENRTALCWARWHTKYHRRWRITNRQ